MRTISVSSRSSDCRLFRAALCLGTVLLLTGCIAFRPLGTPSETENADTAVSVPPETTIPAESDPLSETQPAETAESTESADTAAEGEPAQSAEDYFRGSLFVGDSVMEGIARYVRAQRNQKREILADAAFLTDVNGIRVADLVGDTADDRIRYRYKGKDAELSTVLDDRKPTRIILLLGMNDLSCGYTVKETAARYERLIDSLRADYPDTALTVLTVTPKTDSEYLPWYCRNENFGSVLLNELADALKTMCAGKKIDCIDTNAAIRNADGHLPDQYCSDGYVHLNDAGAEILVQAMEAFAEQRGTIE